MSWSQNRFYLLFIILNTSCIYKPSQKTFSGFEPINLSFEVIDMYFHNSDDYTQGLVVDEDTIFESTGIYGSSKLKKYNYKSGEIFTEIKLKRKYFGEGVTKMNDKLYQLTWKENKIFIYNTSDLKLIEEKKFFTDGWGITNDQQHLIISNGTSTLHYLDPEDFKVVKTLQVFDNRGAVKRLNELEFINNEIYSNVWHKDEIIVIDPNSGFVIKKINLKSYVKRYKKGFLSGKVLNGIAYDSIKDHILITGKGWPYLYKISIIKDIK